MSRKTLFLAAGVVGAALILLAAFTWAPLRYRLDEAQIFMRGVLSPPERAAFIPQGQVAAATLPPTLAPTASPTPPPPTATLAAATALPSPTASATPQPLPTAFALKGVVYQDQHGLWNYCAPANLAMALSYWGVQQDRLVVGQAIKPNELDKNVMPYEMADYVNTQTALRAVARLGGDEALLKTLIVNGYPVVVEKGAYIKDFTGVVSWMGHYEVVTGYDDAAAEWIAQDSFYTPDFRVPYDQFQSGWRSFNYAYLVVYPPEKEAEVMALLGPQADATRNAQYAAEKAAAEIYTTTGVDQFFAWFNRGSSLKELQDFGGAAAAYDEAFAVYNTLPEDKSVRPYRILWYQTGPYFAYYYTGRYYDVISFANTALDAILDKKPALEESFYWRGMAKAALGDLSGAEADYRTSLEWHPGFEPSVFQLQQLGLAP